LTFPSFILHSANSFIGRVVMETAFCKIHCKSKYFVIRFWIPCKIIPPQEWQWNVNLVINALSDHPTSHSFLASSQVWRLSILSLIETALQSLSNGLSQWRRRCHHSQQSGETLYSVLITHIGHKAQLISLTCPSWRQKTRQWIAVWNQNARVVTSSYCMRISEEIHIISLLWWDYFT
jgi:hypothetical protein